MPIVTSVQFQTGSSNCQDVTKEKGFTSENIKNKMFSSIGQIQIVPLA